VRLTDNQNQQPTGEPGGLFFWIRHAGQGGISVLPVRLVQDQRIDENKSELDRELFINPDHIVLIEKFRESTCTEVLLTDGRCLTVEDSPRSIVEQLRKLDLRSQSRPGEQL